MSNLRVVHRKPARSGKAVEFIKGFLGVLFFAIAVVVGLLALSQSVEHVIKYFTK